MSEAAHRRSSNETAASKNQGFHSLLVPVDLTPLSDRVVARISLLPLADSPRITLLHVIPENLTASEQRGIERDVNRALADDVRHLRELVPGARIEALVKRGSPAREIAASANKLKAELIVMGRGGGRPLREAFLGSTAERVIRDARLPVLAVQRPARTPYHRPLCALDLDETAPEVVRLLLRMIPPPRPFIEVVHAYDTPFRGFIYPSLSDDEAEDVKSELREKAERELGDLLAATLGKNHARLEDGPSWKMHVKCGPPRTVVEKAMKKSGTDLLVLGSRGYSGAAYMLLGTVAGDLLRSAKCDVLIVPPAQ